jgi:hypothetical protein
MRDVSTNDRNNRTISRTLRRYLDPGFAEGFLGHAEIEVWACGEKYSMESYDVHALE